MPATHPLTERQHQVLYMIALGYTDRQIASVLDIKLTSVHTHVLRIRAALGATNRAHAVYLAGKHDLLPGMPQGLAHAQ